MKEHILAPSQWNANQCNYQYNPMCESLVLMAHQN